MSKSFKDKRRSDIDYDDSHQKKPHISTRQRRQEKQFHNAIRSKDLETLIKYSEEDLD